MSEINRFDTQQASTWKAIKSRIRSLGETLGLTGLDPNTLSPTMRVEGIMTIEKGAFFHTSPHRSALNRVFLQRIREINGTSVQAAQLLLVHHAGVVQIRDEQSRKDSSWVVLKAKYDAVFSTPVRPGKVVVEELEGNLFVPLEETPHPSIAISDITTTPLGEKEEFGRTATVNR